MKKLWGSFFSRRGLSTSHWACALCCPLSSFSLSLDLFLCGGYKLCIYMQPDGKLRRTFGHQENIILVQDLNSKTLR